MGESPDPQELDKQKDELFLIAAHQFRTPLSVIKGYVELLNDGAYCKIPKKAHEVFSNIDKNNERLRGSRRQSVGQE